MSKPGRVYPMQYWIGSTTPYAPTLPTDAPASIRSPVCALMGKAARVEATVTVGAEGAGDVGDGPSCVVHPERAGGVRWEVQTHEVDRGRIHTEAAARSGDLELSERVLPQLHVQFTWQRE
jgi:hypothetical protein